MHTNGRAQPTRAASENGLSAVRRRPGAYELSRDGVSVSKREGGDVIDIQRARLLAAITDVVWERGAGEVTVAHIVDRAGVSRRTFYELFDDREECFLTAFEEGAKRASRYLLDGYDPGARWAERLRVALGGLLSFFDVDRGTGRLLVVGSLEAGAKALECRKRALDQIVAVVDSGRGESKTGLGLSPLMAEGVVGAVFSVIHARMTDADERPLIELLNPLMSIVVMPYLGPAAARRELEKPVLDSVVRPVSVSGDPLRGLAMRITYRTVKVLIALAERPGSSNRQIGEAAGIADQGQTSKLLHRLDRLGLVENSGPGHRSGERNVWALSPKGREVERAVTAQQTR